VLGDLLLVGGSGMAMSVLSLPGPARFGTIEDGGPRPLRGAQWRPTSTVGFSLGVLRGWQAACVSPTPLVKGRLRYVEGSVTWPQAPVLATRSARLATIDACSFNTLASSAARFACRVKAGLFASTAAASSVTRRRTKGAARPTSSANEVHVEDWISSSVDLLAIFIARLGDRSG